VVLGVLRSRPTALLQHVAQWTLAATGSGISSYPPTLTRYSSDVNLSQLQAAQSSLLMTLQ